MDEIKIKHQDIESNENKNMAMLERRIMAMELFKAVDDDSLIGESFLLQVIKLNDSSVLSEIEITVIDVMQEVDE